MARGQHGGAQASSARDLRMFVRNRMWRDHWYVLLAVGAIMAALFASAFVQFSTSQTHVYRLEVTDAPMMERVFRSGEPWVVLCSGPDDELPEVFDKVSPRLGGKSFVGVLDCAQKLPKSGKSVLQRYSLKRSVSPTVFTVANGEKPKQVFLDYLQSAKALAKHVKAQTKKTMKQVQNSAQLEARCLSRPSCVLLLRGQKFNSYEKQWIDKLMHQHRRLSFAWMDSTSSKLSMESMMPDARRGEHRLVLFQRRRDPQTSKKMAVAAKAYRGEGFDPVSVGMFLEENVNSESLKALSKSPKILHRKKNGKNTFQSDEADTGSEGRRHARHRHRHHHREREEEKSDDHFFPQHIDESEADNLPLDDVEEDEEVMDLDDESGKD